MNSVRWSEEGIGYQLFTGNNLDNIKNFLINKDKKIDKEAVEKVTTEKELETLLGEPVSFRIADIINKLESSYVFKGFQLCRNSSDEEHIGIGPLYPWEMSYFDLRLLTEGNAKKVLKEYAEELGLVGVPQRFVLSY